MMKSVFFLIFCLVSTNTVLAQYKYPKNEKVFLEGTVIGYCMAHKLGELGVDIRTAAPSNREFVNNFKRRNGIESCSYNNDDFFDYLLIKADRSCDYSTGTEEELRNWILSQKDNSIEFLSVLEASLKINDLNLFDSVLTLHQLLRNEARYYSKKYYEYSSSKKKSSKFWSKFIDVRGDLIERNPKLFKGDHGGTWYRIWGIFVFAFMDYDENDWFIERSLKLRKTYLAGFSVEAVKYLNLYHKLIGEKSYSVGPDIGRKIQVNVHAAFAVHNMIEAHTTSHFPYWFKPDEHCKPQSGGYFQ